jgi:hypothetical protein
VPPQCLRVRVRRQCLRFRVRRQCLRVRVRVRVRRQCPPSPSQTPVPPSPSQTPVPRRFKQVLTCLNRLLREGRCPGQPPRPPDTEQFLRKLSLSLSLSASLSLSRGYARCRLLGVRIASRNSTTNPVSAPRLSPWSWTPQNASFTNVEFQRVAAR